MRVAVAVGIAITYQFLRGGVDSIIAIVVTHKETLHDLAAVRVIPVRALIAPATARAVVARIADLPVNLVVYRLFGAKGVTGFLAVVLAVPPNVVDETKAAAWRARGRQ